MSWALCWHLTEYKNTGCTKQWEHSCQACGAGPHVVFLALAALPGKVSQQCLLRAARDTTAWSGLQDIASVQGKEAPRSESWEVRVRVRGRVRLSSGQHQERRGSALNKAANPNPLPRDCSVACYGHLLLHSSLHCRLARKAYPGQRNPKPVPRHTPAGDGPYFMGTTQQSQPHGVLDSI